jgi:hypothetical protein
MEDLSTRIPGVSDLIVQNTPANGNVEMVCTTQRPPKRRRILQVNVNIQVTDSPMKNQLANQSKVYRTPERMPRDTLVDKQRQGAVESDILGENRSRGCTPELRGMLSPAEAQRVGDTQHPEDQFIDSIFSEKQSAVNLPSDTTHSTEQNDKQNTVEGPVAKAHPKVKKAPRIPVSGSARLLPKTKKPLHTAHKKPSANGHRVSPSPRRQKLSVASQPSAPASKEIILKASVMAPAQGSKFCQSDTASTVKIGDSYRKIFNDLDKYPDQSWSESSLSPSDQREQTPQESEAQVAKDKVLGNWARTPDSRLEPEHYQRVKETHPSDLSLNTHMVGNKEANSVSSKDNF